MIPRKLFGVGEIMRHTGLGRQSIHNYTQLGLIREEERTESGHRLFGEEVFNRLERVKALQGDGLTLREIVKRFEEENK